MKRASGKSTPQASRIVLGDEDTEPNGEVGVAYLVAKRQDANGGARVTDARFHALSLEEARAAWVLGDWLRLARHRQARFDDAPDRELLALLIGSACMQTGNDEAGRLLIAQARSWGCSARLIAQVLVAGVHFTLGRAEMLRNEGARSREHVLAAIQSISPRRGRTAGNLPRPRRKPTGTTEGIPAIAIGELGTRLGSSLPAPSPSESSLTNWEMTRDDGPILRYLFAVHQPRRHLEFGTWRGWGTLLCLETTAATVWTINLPDGENKADGSWAYGERVVDPSSPPGATELRFGSDAAGPIVYHRTDAGSYIGWLFRKKGLGHRVCQILCDSRQWDHSQYPADFFDSAFIDGGHQTDVVINDTRKALSVVRSGGMIVWHDFCPVAELRGQDSVVGEVTGILEAVLPQISPLFSQLYWINPSMILLGIKK